MWKKAVLLIKSGEVKCYYVGIKKDHEVKCYKAPTQKMSYGNFPALLVEEGLNWWRKASGAPQ
jgi:hypothetical protein